MTDAIRAERISEVQPGDQAVVASVLELRFGNADRTETRSYRPGDVVALREGRRHEGDPSSHPLHGTRG